MEARTTLLGFAIGGSGEKLLVRAVGPGLEDLGVVDYLEDPIIRFYDSGGQFGTNDDWGAELVRDYFAERNGPIGRRSRFEDGSSDKRTYSPLRRSLRPSFPTMEAKEGSLLWDIYNGDPDDSESSLANVAMRGLVGTGDEVLIAGFYIEEICPSGFSCERLARV